jgi:hypothetical protein
MFIWIKLTVKFDYYFIYLETKEKSVWPTFPFFNLSVLPTQTQEWGSSKYFILENIPHTRKFEKH